MNALHTDSRHKPTPVDFRKLYERRGSPRSAFTLRATVLSGGADLTVDNLSTTGMVARSKSARFPGSLIKLRLEVPLVHDTIEVWAKVLEISPGKRGITHKLQFCYLSPRALMSLYRFFDRSRHLWR